MQSLDFLTVTKAGADDDLGIGDIFDSELNFSSQSSYLCEHYVETEGIESDYFEQLCLNSLSTTEEKMVAYLGGIIIYYYILLLYIYFKL